MTKIGSWSVSQYHNPSSDLAGRITVVVLFERKGSGTGFVDYVKRGFRGSPETAEAGCGDHFANPFLA
jgi:hypothetical protein